jgi:hypothetical protein
MVPVDHASTLHLDRLQRHNMVLPDQPVVPFQDIDRSQGGSEHFANMFLNLDRPAIHPGQRTVSRDGVGDIRNKQREHIIRVLGRDAHQESPCIDEASRFDLVGLWNGAGGVAVIRPPAGVEVIDLEAEELGQCGHGAVDQLEIPDGRASLVQSHPTALRSAQLGRTVRRSARRCRRWVRSWHRPRCPWTDGA